MDSDAQKVIAISLGKIATSRCQRGGPSLHRSLLVASVLYKARTTYVDDAFPAPAGGPDEDDGAPGDVSTEADARPSGAVTSTPPPVCGDCDSAAGGGDDKENVQPAVRCAKRRRTLDDEDCAKRCRRDTALWRRCADDDGDEPDCEREAAMEVESISSLVLAFNSGLRGLAWDAEDDDRGLAPLRRGVSLPDLCSERRTPPAAFPVAVLAL